MGRMVEYGEDAMDLPLGGIRLHTTEAAFNLALEDCLLDALGRDAALGKGVFLLWRNAPSIIVGRHQNTAQEVNAALVSALGLPVVRRMSGGGAVYHDLGNLNYSFIVPQEADAGAGFGAFLRRMCAALAALGVPATPSGRNDLVCEGRKISGSAQVRRQGKVLHHGTLLVDVDLQRMDAVLAGNPDKFHSRGIASVRARVRNVAELLPPGVGMAEVQAALLAQCAAAPLELPTALLERAETLAREKYRTWAWNYGASPPFDHRYRKRFPWGAVELCLRVEHGVITACRIHGDFFASDDVAALEARLCGVRHSPDALDAALRGVPWQDYFTGCDPEAMRAFCCEAGEDTASMPTVPASTA